jgi:gliding motility-associated-like protein
MDQRLRDILKNKLSSHESAVPESLWENVSSSIGGSNAGFVGSVKMWILTAAAVAATAVSLFVWISESGTQTKTPVNTENITAPEVESNNQAPLPESIQQETTGLSDREHTTQHTGASPTTSTTENIMDPVVMESAIQQKAQPAAFSVPTAEINPEPTQQMAASPEQDGRVVSFTAIVADKNELIYFFIPAITEADHYEWNFGDGERSAEMSPQHDFDAPGEYSVSLQIKRGETILNTTQIIACFPPAMLQLPTIFTPNGDGKNDLFDPMELSSNIDITLLRIFDQAGRLIYENTLDGRWNGLTTEGSEAPEGNYLVEIRALDLRQQPVEKRGYIYLQR